MEWLLERFNAARDRIAFVHEHREVTYGGVADRIRAFGDELRARDVQPGERVAVLGDFSPEVVCLVLALARNANIIIPFGRESMVELDVALAVSGCDWFAEFDHANITPAITRQSIAANNMLLTEFLKKGRPGLILFSSGSTGTPKAILHDFNRVTEKFRVPRQAVTAIPFLMLDHFGGINTILAITSSLGKVVTVSDRSVNSICDAIARYRVNLLPTTPSFLALLMASRAYRDFDMTSLTRITYGTEVMPQATLDRLRIAFPGVELQQTYGLSELGVLRSKSRGDDSLWVRIGGSGFQTKVVDGILWIKSEYAMVGYLNAPSEFDAEGWFNTKDRVEVDGEFFRILGRITDLINVGGQKVYPTEIEDVIMGLDNIEDVAVYGEPHTLLGQIIVAKVVPIQAEDAESLKTRIRLACRAKLAPFKVPAKVILAEGGFHTARHKKVRRAT
jgi:acyl-CoA synthetase (AMP-forming)/AMP-acid ligase II